MIHEYITAVIPAEGGEKPLSDYLNTMENLYGFAYPLPLMIPLAGFSRPFPPDRVDRKKLKALPALSFSGISRLSGAVLLELQNPELIEEAANCLRGIHGMEKPKPLPSPLFDWKGLLLQPAGFPGKRELPENFPPVPDIKWQTYRYVQMKISWRKDDFWWNHFRWEILWKIRKARSS